MVLLVFLQRDLGISNSPIFPSIKTSLMGMRTVAGTNLSEWAGISIVLFTRAHGEEGLLKRELKSKIPSSFTFTASTPSEGESVKVTGNSMSPILRNE